jgi:excinuclease ABC subunit B
MPFCTAWSRSLYARTTADFKRGTFRVKGDTVDIFPAYMDHAYRISFFGDDIEELSTFDVTTGKTVEKDDPHGGLPG